MTKILVVDNYDSFVYTLNGYVQQLGADTDVVRNDAFPESEIADRIAEYHALGIDEFVFSGYPHLEEAWWFGEGVMPILRRRGLWAPEVERAGGAARTAAFATLEGRR